MAKITINGGSSASFALGTTVQLSIDNSGGPTIVSKVWEIVDQPSSLSGGNPDEIDTTDPGNTKLVLNHEGSYLISCEIKYAGNTTEKLTAIAAVRQVRSGIRVPALGEGCEFTNKPDRWAGEINKALRQLDRTIGDPMVITAVAASAANLARGDIVFFGGMQSVGEGSNSLQLPLVKSVASGAARNARGPLGLVEEEVGSWGDTVKLVRVRIMGRSGPYSIDITTGNSPNVNESVGKPLFLMENIGDIIDDENAYRYRQIGHIINAEISEEDNEKYLILDVWFDGTAPALTPSVSGMGFLAAGDDVGQPDGLPDGGGAALRFQSDPPNMLPGLYLALDSGSGGPSWKRLLTADDSDASSSVPAGQTFSPRAFLISDTETEGAAYFSKDQGVAVFPGGAWADLCFQLPSDWSEGQNVSVSLLFGPAADVSNMNVQWRAKLGLAGGRVESVSWTDLTDSVSESVTKATGDTTVFYDSAVSAAAMPSGLGPGKWLLLRIGRKDGGSVDVHVYGVSLSYTVSATE